MCFSVTHLTSVDCNREGLPTPCTSRCYAPLIWIGTLCVGSFAHLPLHNLTAAVTCLLSSISHSSLHPPHCSDGTMRSFTSHPTCSQGSAEGPGCFWVCCKKAAPSSRPFIARPSPIHGHFTLSLPFVPLHVFSRLLLSSVGSSSLAALKQCGALTPPH